jgi:hypothetical protein
VPLEIGPLDRELLLDVPGRTKELATTNCMIDANVVMTCQRPLLTKQRPPYQKSFENSTEKGASGEVITMPLFITK